jgi:ornithine carbamoyltransferase
VSHRTRHLLTLADLSPDEIRALITLAASLKDEWATGGNQPLLAGKIVGLIFHRPSLRTRVSFEVGASQLGGAAIYLSPQEIQLGQREGVADRARELSRYLDALVVRVENHGRLQQLADLASIPLINGLSDRVHPCEILGDLFTIYEKRGRLRGLKLSYVGDGNNIAHSLLLGASKVGMEIRVATPVGFEPDTEFVRQACLFAQESGGAVAVLADPCEAVAGVDIIYTDAWAGMGQAAEREKRLPHFRPYQVNGKLLSLADRGAMVMHCLPAHRGEEITSEVLDGPQSIVMDQAENKLHMHKAILAWLVGGFLPVSVESLRETMI